jgi:cysteine sulfinate desulfinase/cysteine desulfurase-like protein
MSLVIYLDHNATTPVLPEVLEAMIPYLTTKLGIRGAERHSAMALIGHHKRDIPMVVIQ